MPPNIVARISHTHPLFKEDNATVYYDLEEATRGTQHAATLKPYQRAKNGRAASNALITQHAGKDKWEKELTTQDELVHTRKWSGTTSYTLEAFVGLAEKSTQS